MRQLRILYNLCCRDGAQEYKIMFKDGKTRSAWEADLMAAKRSLEAAIVNKQPPEYMCRIPVKTRAGMQVR